AAVPLHDGPLRPHCALWVEPARPAPPAVVNVSAREARSNDPRAEFFRRFFEGDRPALPRSSLGSGFILSPDGYVVTNNHVVSGGGDIVVRLDPGSENPAQVISTDPATSRSRARACPSSHSATRTSSKWASRSWPSATPSGLTRR